jgi:hypothetical protein
MSVRSTVHARTLSNLRQGWTPAGPRPSYKVINSSIEMGSVYDSLAAFKRGAQSNSSHIQPIVFLKKSTSL